MNEEQNTSASPSPQELCASSAERNPGADMKALAAALAPQETTFDEWGIRWYVTRREHRVDVSLRTLDREHNEHFAGQPPLWSCTAALAADGLRLIKQECGSGEDITQLFPSLQKHLDANPVLVLPAPTDERYLRVSGLPLRVRRFNRGITESVRVDWQAAWKDDTAPTWLHAFDAELIFAPFEASPYLRIGAESEVWVKGWGQLEHLTRFAVYAALVSKAPASEVVGKLPSLLEWATDESLLAAEVSQ